MDNDDYPTDLGWAIFANPYGYDKIGGAEERMNKKCGPHGCPSEVA